MEYQKYLLRDVGDIVSGATPKTAIAENFGGDIPWLTPADLSGYTQKYISRGARNLTKQGYDSCSTQMMPSGTVLFSSRAPIGYVAIAKNPICTNQGFKSIVPKSFINSEFLYYQLIYLRKTIQNMGNGTTFKEISATKFGSVQVIAPPLEEQERIVSRIEELFSQLDASVAELKTAKERLKVYRQAVLKEAFDTALQDNPPLMPIEKLLTTERKGMSTGPFGTMIKKHEHQAIGVPMLGIENIGHGNFIDGNKIFVTSEKARELKSFALLAGDIIISRSGTVGELCAVPERMEGALLSTNLMRISLNSNIIRSDYFIYLFQSKGIVLDQVKELCKGSTRIFLNQAILKRIMFPVPDISKQKKIIEILESRMSVCDSIEKTVDTALQQAEALRQSILKKAFEGRL